MNEKQFNARSHAMQPKATEGLGDDVPCTNCGKPELDTGLECANCGHDNHEAVTGKAFKEQP